MNWLTGPAIEGVIKLFKGIGLLRDPEQEEKARAALREAQAQFLSSTASWPYTLARVLVIFGAIWDIFANQSRAWAAAVANMAAQGLGGFFELVPLAWLFFGPEGWAVIKEVFAAAAANRMTPKPNASSPADTGSRDGLGRRDP